MPQPATGSASASASNDSFLSPSSSVMTTSRELRLFPEDVDIVSITSANLTASDLPGAGRTLGRVYSFLGRRLEHALNTLAHLGGHGPGNATIRVVKRDYAYGRTIRADKYTTEDRTKIKKDLKKLITYSKSVTIFIHDTCKVKTFRKVENGVYSKASS